MKDSGTVPSQLAMAVAGISNLKFNEAVSRNYYRPRSDAEPGKAREFDELEMFGLYVMAKLLGLGLDLPMAASRANDVRNVLEGHPSTPTIWVNSGARADSVWPEGVPEGDYPSISIILHVKEIKKEIKQLAKIGKGKRNA